jgi:alpha-lytic protease prodomain-containing protein/trypsin
MKVTAVVKVVAMMAAAGLSTVGVVAVAPAFTLLNSELLPAMQRDLGLTRAQAMAELKASAKADRLVAMLSQTLGPDAYAGAIFHPSTGRVEIRVADPTKLALVRASGADAVPVRYSAHQLDSAVDRLNAREDSAPRSITGWGVDSSNDRVTVTVAPGGLADARKFLADSGVDAAVVQSASQSRPMYDVEGGDPYYIGQQARCSVGFAVRTGFLSAGHCAAYGNTIYGYNQQPMGSFVAHQFPGSDYSLARVNSSWTPRGRTSNGTRVSGATEAPIGSAVCKAGSSSGWTCGRIVAKNQSVVYPQGTVTGLISTDLRADEGDSGGPLLAGNQAQGLLSGGNSTTTYFFPIGPALAGTGTSLLIG